MTDPAFGAIQLAVAITSGFAALILVLCGLATPLVAVPAAWLLAVIGVVGLELRRKSQP